MWVRGGLAIDGFFALPREQCGAPTLAARRTVVISALPKVLDLLWLYLLWTSSAQAEGAAPTAPTLRSGTSSRGESRIVFHLSH